MFVTHGLFTICLISSFPYIFSFYLLNSKIYERTKEYGSVGPEMYLIYAKIYQIAVFKNTFWVLQLLYLFNSNFMFNFI